MHAARSCRLPAGMPQAGRECCFEWQRACGYRSAPRRRNRRPQSNALCRRGDTTSGLDARSRAGMVSRHAACERSCRFGLTLCGQRPRGAWAACRCLCRYCGIAGKVVDKSQCVAPDGWDIPEPVAVTECSSPPCPQYFWGYAAWGPCSATCGTGLQLRSVFCQRASSAGAPVDGTLCSASKDPAPAKSQVRSASLRGSQIE